MLFCLSAASGRAQVAVVESGQNQIILTVNASQFRLQPVDVNGEKFQQILPLPGATRLTIPGAPQLPVFSALVGIPATANPQIRVLESQLNEIPDIDLILAPDLQFEPSPAGGYFKPADPIRGGMYQQDEFFPAELAEIVSIETIRGLRTAKVLIYPFRYNPLQRLLHHAAFLKIELNFNSQLPPISQTAPVAQDRFDRGLAKLIVNYPAAKNWRQPAPAHEKVGVQPEWYQPENPHYKLLVSSDGLYRLTRSDLLNSGVDLSVVDLQTIKIFNKGEQVPVRVSGEADSRFDGGDYLEFYGRRNYGDAEFYDDYSDTNVYWLSYNGSPGKRFAEKQSLEGDWEELTGYRQRKHFERDLTYYRGDGRSVLETPPMPGEGWVWKEFFVNDQLVFSFNLTNPDLQSVELCTLTARLRGITIDPLSPDHLAWLSINGNEIGRAAFDDRQEVFPEFSFSASLLRPGLNQLKIKSEQTGAALNKFYLDWIELSFPATFSLVDGYTEFDAPEDREAGLSLWNLPADSFSVYNLTQQYYVSDVEQRSAQRYIIKLLSAGFDDGNFCQIRVNNSNLINGGRRGHNIAVFDTSTGMADGNYFFDTHEKSANADSMAAFIATIPEGKLVLVGVRDEGSYRMTEAAHQALESVGSGLTRQLKFRDGYVLLGRKGAAPGTVPELLMARGQGPALLVDTLLTFHPGSVQLMFQDRFIRGDRWLIAGSDSLKQPERIVRHQHQNLAGADNGADYIFIYHSKFRITAEQFSQFWSQRNYRTRIVNIEDIYDEFNYGIKHVQAVKNFLAHAYRNWQPPAPAFVMLIGDASWDPKLNAPTSVKIDYIPTYGNPVSDNWLVCFDGENDLLPDMFIGRLAIESESEGERLMRKVERYADYPSREWKKYLLFINGGFNASEQYIFGSQSADIINNQVQVPPASCQSVVISKELEGLYEGEKRDEIVSEINAGKLWVNFIGHGGSGTWELMFHDQQVFELENAERLPLVTSFTCHTGRFANPQVTNFGENFVNYSDAGAIGFIGSSGWGFVYEDKIIAEKLFETTLKDTVQQMGKALALAKIKFWSQLYPTRVTESIVHQFSLLGDPALEITLPDKPDLALQPGSLSYQPENPVESDSLLNIKLDVFNFGLATTDSVEVDIKHQYGLTAPPKVMRSKLGTVGFSETLDIGVPIAGQPGEHQLTFELDPDRRIEEADENNNQITLPLFIGASRISVSMPPNHAIVPVDAAMLQVYNPEASGQQVVCNFELDTVATFDSPAKIQSGLIEPGKLVTNWRPSSLAVGSVFYWRARELRNGVAGNWVSADFTTGDNFGWRQHSVQQFADSWFENVVATHQGVELAKNKVVFRVESSGFDDLNYATIFVNSTPVATSTRGHNIAVCNAAGNFIEFRKFDTHDSPDDVSKMTAFINDTPHGYYVLVGIMDSGEHSMNELAYQALESIGSQFCRNVGFRDSWAIIGRKGAAIGSVAEKHVPRYQGSAVVEDSLVARSSQGVFISPEIGPANGWKDLIWNAEGESGLTSVSIDVLGYNKTTAAWDTLLSGLQAPSIQNLATIDPNHYPFLKLKGNLSSRDISVTPRLKWWQVEYDPVSDLAIGAGVVDIYPDSLISGSAVKISAEVHNVGYIAQDTVKVKLSISDPNQQRFILDTFELYHIEAGAFQPFVRQWDTRGVSGNRRLFINIDPNGVINELSEQNNHYSHRIVVLPDTVAPNIEVTFDGRHIQPGDYVARTPVVLIRVFDNSPVTIQDDTTRINLLLNGERVAFRGNEPVINFLPVSAGEDSMLLGTVRFTPRLSDGEYSLDIIIKDASDNLSSRRIEFVVLSELALEKVYNYPNPFSANTCFTFHLTQPAERLTIQIYTTAGRKIQAIEHYHLEAGYHQIYWDGLDADGDPLANGAYLYKITARAGERQAAAIEKLAIVR